MRRKVIIFLVFNVILVGFLVHSVWPLLCLLVIDGLGDRISRAELPAPNSDLVEKMPQVIPKIIHQTYATDELPEIWKNPQKSCRELHPDYEYKFWTDNSSRQFIATEYPWFLETWDSYKYNIQRADTIRYFALSFFGGVYIDLDDGCQRRLDPLLAYPAWVRRTKPTGISNDVIGSVPSHPFLHRVIDSLPKYNRNWRSPYITVMSSTGPLFLSIIWRAYSNDVQGEHNRVRILFPDEYMGNSWSFFSHHLGNSWHTWDTQMIFWMGKHWIELTLAGFILGGTFFVVLWYIYNKLSGARQSKGMDFRIRFPFRLQQSRQEHTKLMA